MLICNTFVHVYILGTLHVSFSSRASSVCLTRRAFLQHVRGLIGMGDSNVNARDAQLPHQI